MTITELVEQSYAIAKEKGWHDKPRSPLEALCLIHSEISEACEEARLDGSLNEIHVESTYSSKYIHEVQKPFGFAIELADAVIRIADLCGEMGIDIEKAIKIKHEYNKTKPYRHGKKV